VTYEALLKQAYKKAKTYHKEEEAAKLLLMELSNQDPHQFFINLKTEVDPNFQKVYLEKLDQYLIHHIPVQHLIGHAYFYGYKLFVNEHVLIPRSETEQLVEHVLYYYDTYFSNQSLNVLDLGTGSGCIGLALALEEKNLNVTLSDISLDALEVARKNTQNLGTKVKLIHSDLFKEIKGKFDIIVSNPPYIPEQETVDDMVSKEPSVALYGGFLGTEFYERIIKEIKPFLNERSLIAFEHGFQQKEAIKKIAEIHFEHANIIQLKDLQGKDRFTFIGSHDILK